MKRSIFEFRRHSIFALMLCAMAMLFITSLLPVSHARSTQDPNATLPSTKKAAPAKKATPPSKKTTPPARTSRTNASPSGNASADEIAFWDSIKTSTDPEDFKAYLQQYPNGKFVALAKNKLKALEATRSSTNPSSTTSSSSDAAMPLNPPLPLQSFDFVSVILDDSGKLKSRDTKSAYAFTEDLGGGLKLEMVAIPPGEFMMGSPETERRRSENEGPQHRVRIGYWFYLGKFEVTQAQWRAVMGMDPSKYAGSDMRVPNFKNCDDCPVENVSWDDAVEFCGKLSARTGRDYRLPSEAEWEYAARAGTTTPFAFGETITPEIVNYDGGYPYGNAAKGMVRQKTVPVGSLGIANGFGLFDMHGNVEEWCQDWYHNSYSAIGGGAPPDGSAWLSGGEQKYRVLRGGSWNQDASSLRSAYRTWDTPRRSFSLTGDGFRVVAVVRTQ